jgi:glycosyltransferase involved in cell wall biosynthesis
MRGMWALPPSKRERIIVWPKAYELYSSKAMPVFEAILKIWDRIQPCRFEMIWMVQPDVKIWYEKLFPPHIKQACPTFGRLTREETLDRIARARVMMAPSLSDGIPNTMMEAMALGAAPLVSPLDTIIPVVKNEENVLFAKNLYPDEIADALVRLMSDDELVDRMAANNLVRIREIADRKRIREQALAYYEEVARQARRNQRGSKS